MADTRKTKMVELPVVILTLISTAIIFSVVGYLWSVAVDAPNAGDLGSNGVLIIIGAAQLITFCIQCFIFYRQSALMTVQTEQIKTQTTLTHQDYIATHPPLIRVRPITNVVTPLSNPLTPYKEEIYKITLTHLPISNIGSTNATITSIGLAIFEMNGVGAIRGKWHPEGKECKIIVVPGEKKILRGNGAEGLWEYTIQFPENIVYLRGEIIYHDARGSSRTTSFVRRFDRAKNGFLRIEKSDPLVDYDYED